MSKKQIISRRQVLGRIAGGTVGVVGFPYSVNGSALGKADGVAASERITMGWSGVDWRGSSNGGAFLREKDFQGVAGSGALLDDQFDFHNIYPHELACRGHNVLDCITSRRRTIAPREAAHRSATPGRKVHSNSETEEIIGDPAVCRMLGRSMASPGPL